MDINPRSAAPLLEIRRRARLVNDAVGQASYDDYLSDLQMQAAVERHLEVIGEAFRRLRDEDEATADRIEGHRAFVGLRNVIAHGYDRLVQETIWQTVTDDLPAVIVRVSSLLNELGEE